MGKRRHDWEGLIAEWVQAKRLNAELTQAEFFRAKGVSRSLGSRRIGVRMQEAWGEVQKRATEEVIAKTGSDLAQEAGRMLRLGKSMIATGARNIIPKVADDGSELPPAQQPQTFADSLALTKEGSRIVQTAIVMLHGGDPLKTEAAEETTIDFVLPASQPLTPPDEAAGGNVPRTTPPPDPPAKPPEDRM